MTDAELEAVLKVARDCRRTYRRFSRTPADLDDIQSVAVVGALKRLPTFDPQLGKLETHLWMGARSELGMYIRRGQLDGVRRVNGAHPNRTRRHVLAIVMDLHARDGEDDSEWRSRSKRDPLAQSVEYDLATYVERREFRRSLRPRDRQIIELLEQGRSHAEISAEIGLAKSQVGRDARRIAVAYAEYTAA